MRVHLHEPPISPRFGTVLAVSISDGRPDVDKRLQPTICRHREEVIDALTAAGYAVQEWKKSICTWQDVADLIENHPRRVDAMLLLVPGWIFCDRAVSIIQALGLPFGLVGSNLPDEPGNVGVTALKGALAEMGLHPVIALDDENEAAFKARIVGIAAGLVAHSQLLGSRHIMGPCSMGMYTGSAGPTEDMGTWGVTVLTPESIILADRTELVWRERKLEVTDWARFAVGLFGGDLENPIYDPVEQAAKGCHVRWHPEALTPKHLIWGASLAIAARDLCQEHEAISIGLTNQTAWSHDTEWRNRIGTTDFAELLLQLPEGPNGPVNPLIVVTEADFKRQVTMAIQSKLARYVIDGKPVYGQSALVDVRCPFVWLEKNGRHVVVAPKKVPELLADGWHIKAVGMDWRNSGTNSPQLAAMLGASLQEQLANCHLGFQDPGFFHGGSTTEFIAKGPQDVFHTQYEIQRLERPNGWKVKSEVVYGMASIPELPPDAMEAYRLFSTPGWPGIPACRPEMKSWTPLLEQHGKGKLYANHQSIVLAHPSVNLEVGLEAYLGLHPVTAIKMDP